MAEKKFVTLFRSLGRPTVAQWITLGAALLIAVGCFAFLRSFVACWQLTSLPGALPERCAQAPSTSGAQTPPAQTASGTSSPATGVPTSAAPQVELPPPWDGASRLNILFIGLDYNDWRAGEGAPRSDTMILFTIDPLSKTAGMLSVPRDMWVNIPGFGYNKINSAYSLGVLYNLPGGGAELAKRTVENFLGVPVHHYVQVDFTAFERMIDIIGGVCLDVPEAITVGRTYENSAHLEPGYQCLDGKSTLGYARARYTEYGDVDRAKRQMQVILAIRDKVLSNLPALVTQAVPLYNELSAGVHTDLSLDDLLRLGMLAKDIPLDSIQQGVINYEMMQDAKTFLGGQEVDILRPYPDKIRELVDRIFGGGAMRPMAAGDSTSLMQQEAARVIFVNGAGVAGLASATADYFKGQGMNVVAFGNPTDYPDQYHAPFPARTILIIHSGKPYVTTYLWNVMGFSSNSQLKFDFDPEAPADIVVGLGSDWGNNNPLP